VDSIQEFRGTDAGNMAGSGTGGGGQFQLITKSGTNNFHGNINEYHRDVSTVANDWFNNQAGVRRPNYIRNQFGGNIGGPILKDRLFFFFNYSGSRIVQSGTQNRIVPLDSYRAGNVSYIKASSGGTACAATSRQNTTPQCIGIANAKTLDPQGQGFNPNMLAVMANRYPRANLLTQGDGVNTGVYRFTFPQPDNHNIYVGKIDFNLTQSQRIWARATVTREDRVYAAPQFPTDPLTFPFQDRSYGYVIGHNWIIGSNKVNSFEYGDNITVYNFPTNFNPTGINTFTFGGGTTTFLNGAYASPSSQRRRIPIPVVRDDFNWTIGRHSLSFGGTFKFIKTNSLLVSDFNTYTLGLGGNTLTLNSSLRPSDIRGGTTAATTYDSAFALALGRVGAISSDYNYTASGNVTPQGNGAVRRYRYYQTELYFGDIWKVTPHLTLDYGVRYQLYSVPFEANGFQSVQNTNFDSYFGARVAQSRSGISGNGAVPFITYQLGGKANNGPALYSPNYKDFAPRFAFAYNPGFDPKTVFNGSIGIVFDRTVINAVNFVQDQSSYLFQNTANRQYGSSNANSALLNDPRIGSNLSVPAAPTAPALSKPYTPYVTGGVGTGLADNQFNTIIDPKLKDPYSIMYNFGIQHEFPANFVMRLNYVGRQGRRLLAQADASQVIDFPDSRSGQTLNQAFSNMVIQSRASGTVTNQPWFENQSSCRTQCLYSALGSLVLAGDFADFMQALAANGLVAPNVGMPTQFAGNTFMTNKGFSSYNGFLATLSKGNAKTVRFDLNYTWSHSIDNTSAVANFIASSQGYGFICDATQPRACRANSDFDITHVITSNFIFDLPFGRGRAFGANTPIWLDELIGGWTLSGIPGWRSGQALNTNTNAFVAGYANNSPAIFNGDRAAIRPRLHKASNGSVTLFDDPVKAQNSFVGPIGLRVGDRNVLRMPHVWGFDAGLAKTFKIVPDKVNMKFRADAFNVFNHPNFSAPTTANQNIFASTFGTLTTMQAWNQTSFRVAQFALRLEF
ncbi:MAG: TonB-dependent receptor, partial [Acidobacteriaceae bacterium]|nr:TonB-dependent receptor [Acidobacteriaceae bacterium]